jgi:hypothetical protein
MYKSNEYETIQVSEEVLEYDYSNYVLRQKLNILLLEYDILQLIEMLFVWKSCWLYECWNITLRVYDISWIISTSAHRVEAEPSGHGAQ